jgi:hypothetical protein
VDPYPIKIEGDFLVLPEFEKRKWLCLKCGWTSGLNSNNFYHKNTGTCIDRRFACHKPVKVPNNRLVKSAMLPDIDSQETPGSRDAYVKKVEYAKYRAAKEKLRLEEIEKYNLV